jgi:acyl-CoA thioester hydrolase
MSSRSLQSHETEIRVRYAETDAMGFLHHGNYLSYFEVARTELFRAQGGDYREMERRGFYFVVVKAEIHFRAPARYDDVLKVKVAIARITPAKLEHEYTITRDGHVIATGKTLLACVDREGKVQRITDDVLYV